jgi:hypothetical protein
MHLLDTERESEATPHFEKVPPGRQLLEPGPAARPWRNSRELLEDLAVHGVDPDARAHATDLLKVMGGAS